MRDVMIRVSETDFALLVRDKDEGDTVTLNVGARRLQGTILSLPKPQGGSHDGLREDGALFIG